MRVLIINTASTGLTGISSVIENFVSLTVEKLTYEFVLNSKVDKNKASIWEKQLGKIHIPQILREKHPIRYMSWLTKLIKENKYDIVHIHANSATSYFDLHASKTAKVPIRIVHAHSSSGKHPVIHQILKPLLNRELTDAVACSDLAGKWLFSRKFIVLNNGIVIDKFRYNNEVRQSYQKNLGTEDNFVIGHIGFMDDVKNHVFLINVFAKLLIKRPKSRLLLIGDGRLRPQIEKQIDNLGITDNVIVFGKRTDVAELYQAMDVFVLPSLFEGFPVTLVEAQTAGLKCFVSDAVTRQANILDLVEYLPIGDENEKHWITALALCQESKDRDKFANIMAKTDFNIENSVRQLLRIYGVS